MILTVGWVAISVSEMHLDGPCVALWLSAGSSLAYCILVDTVTSPTVGILVSAAWLMGHFIVFITTLDHGVQETMTATPRVFYGALILFGFGVVRFVYWIIVQAVRYNAQQIRYALAVQHGLYPRQVDSFTECYGGIFPAPQIQHHFKQFVKVSGNSVDGWPAHADRLIRDMEGGVLKRD